MVIFQNDCAREIYHGKHILAHLCCVVTKAFFLIRPGMNFSTNHKLFVPRFYANQFCKIFPVKRLCKYKPCYVQDQFFRRDIFSPYDKYPSSFYSVRWFIHMQWLWLVTSQQAVWYVSVVELILNAHYSLYLCWQAYVQFYIWKLLQK